MLLGTTRMFLGACTAFLALASPAHALLDRATARTLATSAAISGSPTESSLFAYLYRSSAADSVLEPGERVDSRDHAHAVDVTVGVPTYFVYIDDHPMAMFEHPVRYVLIDAVTGATSVFAAKSYPRIDGLEEPYALTQDRVESPDLFWGNPMMPPMPTARSRTPVRQPPVITAGGTCGIVVAGPPKADHTAAEDKALANAEQNAKDFLANRGVAMVTTIHPKGATEMNDALKAAGMGKDKLWVYYVGHGWTDNGETGPGFDGAPTQDEESCTWKAVACSLMASGAKNVCVVIEACHSGGAIAQFQMKGLTGNIFTSCDAESSSGYWWETDPMGKVTKAVAHYSAALLACAKDSAADSNHDHKVDTNEAHTWASKDATVAGQKPPAMGLLSTLRAAFRRQILIPGSLAPSSTWVPTGMAADARTRQVSCLFVPRFTPSLGARVITGAVDPPVPMFGIQCALPPVAPYTDLAAGLSPGNEFLTGSLNGFTRFVGCTYMGQYPFGPFDAVMSDAAGSQLAYAVVSNGAGQVLQQYSIASGSPVPTGVVASIWHTMSQNGIPITVRDMDKVPLGTYSTLGFYDVLFTLGHAVDATIEYHTLMNNFDGTWAALNAGTTALAEVSDGVGLGALPSLGAARTDPEPALVRLYVLDGLASGADWRILEYDVLGLTTSGEVGVPEELAPAAWLQPPSPNPARDRVLLTFALAPGGGTADLALYDVTGRRVRSLVHNPTAAGSSVAVWDGLLDSGERAAPGIYFARLGLVGQSASIAAQRIVWMK